MTEQALAADQGRLVLVVGPSGVGKDTLIAYCRERLGEADGVVFPRRAITRPAGDDAEDHEPLSQEAFDDRAASGAFLLHWQAHGLSYGVPASVAADIAAGRTVVVNVSRAVLDEARRKCPALRIALIGAAPEILESRLRGRGRENASDIVGRLNRAAALAVTGPDVVAIDNSGRPEVAGETLLQLLMRPAG